MRLLLARHGQATCNLQGRYQGQADPPLVDLAPLQQRPQLSQTVATRWLNSSRPPFQRKSLTWVMAIATRPQFGSLNQAVP